MARTAQTHVDDPKKVAARLPMTPEQSGLTQRQLSFPGFTPSYISRIEAAARVPSLQLIKELSVRLGVSLQWLATGVEPSLDESGEILEAEGAARLGDLNE